MRIFLEDDEGYLHVIMDEIKGIIDNSIAGPELVRGEEDVEVSASDLMRDTIIMIDQSKKHK